MDKKGAIARLLINPIKITGKTDGGFVRKHKPPPPPDEFVIGPEVMERRREFATRQRSKDAPYWHRWRHPEHPDWWEWEIALVKAMLPYFGACEIWALFFSKFMPGDEWRSREDIHALVSKLTEEEEDDKDD